jgi:hypothetical protein
MGTLVFLLEVELPVRLEVAAAGVAAAADRGRPQS